MNTTSEKKSHVLLLCLGFDQPKQATSSIRVKDLLNVFNPFGNVKKIMIFSKTIIVKAFIEFYNVDSAELVKETMHESFINNFGKAKLYYSARDQIVCSNNFIDYWEAGAPVSPKSSLPTSKHTSSRKTTSISSLQVEKKEFEKEGNKESKQSSPIDDQYSNKVKNFQNNQFPPYNPSEWVIGENTVILKKLNLNPQSIAKSELVSSERGFKDHNAMFASNQIQTRVVLVSNLDSFFQKSFEICNFFSIFGVVSKIILMKNLQKALVEFSSVISAQNCVDYLAKRPISFLSIQVNFYKHRNLEFTANTKNDSGSICNEVYVPASQENRSGSDNGKFIVPSTDLVVIARIDFSVPKIEVPIIISEAIESTGAYILGDRVESGSSHFIRIGYRLNSVFDACLVIAKLNGVQTQGCLLDISFAY
jgi:hypothetical protein